MDSKFKKFQNFVHEKKKLDEKCIEQKTNMLRR